MLKYAAMTTLSAEMGLERHVYSKTAHRHDFKYEPEEGFIYVRSRAISSRCNDNYDEFPAEEIKKGWRTFLGKPVFVNHNNDNHRRARGVIIDAALHEDTNPDGSPDTWVEVLMQVDGVRFPKLCQAILAGHIDRTSMGTDVAFSVCSVCNNKATSPAEYCQHIPKMKGSRVYRTTASGRREGILVREICHGLKFFENSLLVEPPADPTAFFLGLDTRGLTMAAARKPARRDPKTGIELCHKTVDGHRDACKFLLGHTQGCDIDWNAVYPDTDERDQPKTSAVVAPNIVGRCQTCTKPLVHPDDQNCPDCEEKMDSDWTPTDRKMDDGRYKTRPFTKVDVARQSMSGLIEHFEVPLDLSGHFASATVAAFDDPCLGCGQAPATQVIRANGKDYSMCGQCASAMFGPDIRMRQYPTRMKDPGKPEGYTLMAAKTAEGVCTDCHHSLARHSSPDGKTMSCGKCSCKSSISEPAMNVSACQCGGRVAYAGRTTAGAMGYCTSCGLRLHRTASSGWSKTAVEHGYCVKCDLPIRKIEDGSASPSQWQHDMEQGAGVPHQAVPGGSKHEGSLVEASNKRVSDMTPEEQDAHHKAQAAGRKWNTDHPVHVDNVIDHWNAATDHERETGMNWYSDAHHLTKHIANDTGHDMTTAAGLMSNYSPQTHWASNMINASKAMRAKKGVGGKGSGIFADARQAHKANQMMGTEGETKTHYDKVLNGPKTKAFAHLIEHGGNKDPKSPKVVVDRHALSVAAGDRASDAAYSNSGLGGVKRYKEVSDTYVKAAAHISKHTGQHVEPHQVQAATWMARQRLNNDADSRVGANSRDTARKWDSYAGEHHPMAMGKEPCTGYAKDQPDDVQHAQDLHEEGNHETNSLHYHVPVTNARRKSRIGIERKGSLMALAFGETRAPADVDTLRDEECPVCGESESYDGNECQVCGFVAPPKMFQDPDLDAAKNMDLRKDNAEAVDGGMEGQVPGSTQPGSDQIPMDPDQLTDQGDIEGMDATMDDGTMPGGNPMAGGDGVVPVDVQSLDDSGNLTPADLPGQDPQAPVDPAMLGPDGMPVQGQPPVDMEAPTQEFDQGGEAFTPGPNAPMGPGGPEGPEGPDPEGGGLLPGEAEIPVASDDGAPLGLTQDQPQPGTPEDGVADLSCPMCGFQGDAAQPMSNNMDDPMATPDTGDGLAAGDVCPNCQGGLLVSVGEMNQQAEQTPPPLGMV